MTLSADEPAAAVGPARLRARLLRARPTSADFLYKTTDYWHPEHERTLLWNDPGARASTGRSTARRSLAAKDAAGTPLARADDLRVTRAAPRRSCVTGADGQLGAELVHAARAASATVVATDRARRSTSRTPTRSSRRCARVAPGARSSTPPPTRRSTGPRGERARATRSTRVAPGVLAEEAKRAGALLVHYSTDYVFDGRATTPYDEDAPDEPLSVYGRTQAGGRAARSPRSGADALVLRTSWVYGRRGRNFLTTMRRLAARARRAARRRRPDRRAELVARARARDGAHRRATGVAWLADRAGSII